MSIPVTLYNPIIYGDTSGDLADHARAAGQARSLAATLATGTLIGDARSLAEHAFGGADTLTGQVQTAAVVIGDAQDVIGHARGADDQLTVGATYEAHGFGDALRLGDHARGGDDLIDTRSAFGSTGFGDAYQLDGHARGGDDVLTGFHSDRHGGVSLYGDGAIMSDHVRGGDDTLSASGGYNGSLFGDAYTLEDKARGGDDHLSGIPTSGVGNLPAARNWLYGDGRELLGGAHGGDDTIVSTGRAADQMWGDAAIVSPDAETGADVFVLAPGGGHDQIRDFEPGKDVIDLSAWGFDGIEDLTFLTTNPEGIVIAFGGGNSLLVHHIRQLGSDDFIFA